MPAIRENYPCPVCEKSHTLYLPQGTVPDLHKQLYYFCTGPHKFSARARGPSGITRSRPW